MKRKKGLHIKSIDPDSRIYKRGIRAGDTLLTINDHTITDLLDYYFYSSDSSLNIEILKNNNKIVKLKNYASGDLGLSFHSMQFQQCGNNCIFCFIDQNPPGMRKTLYEKDEDYRLSFLYGNYVTLTNASSEDLARIAEQKLSPLYISVHAVQPQIREKMLGLKKDDHLLEKISYLTKHKIELHAQIVLCPGINDNKVLSDTINQLSQYYPYLKTLAIVPVGLTAHRQNLPIIKPVTRKIARQILSQVEKMQNNFIDVLGNSFVFLADEFYLLAHRVFPFREHYGEFQQIDNGVGLTRHFIDKFQSAAENFSKSYTPHRRLSLITGELALPVLKKYILPVLNRIKGITAEVYAVKNKFYGRSVTVSGLLTGKDIRETCSSLKIRGEILLPENCINSQGFFLDGITVEDMSKQLRQKVRIINNLEDLIK